MAVRSGGSSAYGDRVVRTAVWVSIARATRPARAEKHSRGQTATQVNGCSPTYYRNVERVQWSVDMRRFPSTLDENENYQSKLYGLVTLLD